MPHKSASDPGGLTPTAARVDRFRRDLEALTGQAPAADCRLALAVSGGPDSLALLLLARAAYPGAVIAATVDHGLRPESGEEAAFVRRLCATLAVPHQILNQPDWLPQGNLQEQARALRYTLLRRWAGDPAGGAKWVATAHQQDDVAETFLMRARRGAGLGGLAAMRDTRPLGAGAPMALVRPLLGWRRAELRAIVVEAGITPVEDPSNIHPRFDRSRIRALLAATNELPPSRLALAAGNLRHAEEALAWAAEREWTARHRLAGEQRVELDCGALPYELRRRLVSRAVECVRRAQDLPGPWRGTGIDRLVATLDTGGTGTIAGVKASAKHGLWRFEMAPARRSL